MVLPTRWADGNSEHNSQAIQGNSDAFSAIRLIWEHMDDEKRVGFREFLGNSGPENSTIIILERCRHDARWCERHGAEVADSGGALGSRFLPRPVV